MSAQPDGYYPRVNAAMLGQHVDMIVSLVGKIASPVGSVVQMQCADGGIIHLSTEHGELPIDLSSDMVVEVIGQVNSPQEVAVRTFRRERKRMRARERERRYQAHHFSCSFLFPLFSLFPPLFFYMR